MPSPSLLDLARQQLTELQARAVEAYFANPEAGYAAAYQAAGAKSRNEKACASAMSRILNSQPGSAYLDALREAQSTRTGVDADLVLTRLAEMMDADPVDILTPEMGLKPVEEWPLVWRRMLNSFDVQEMYAGRAIDKIQVGELKKVKFISKEKVIEMLGRHISVAAFSGTDQRSSNDPVQTSQKIREAVSDIDALTGGGAEDDVGQP